MEGHSTRPSERLYDPIGHMQLSKESDTAKLPSECVGRLWTYASDVDFGASVFLEGLLMQMQI